MVDVYHEWGGDLSVGHGGDLALTSGSDAVSQRVCRRLLTNAGDYLWHLDYGAGLGQFVGLPTRPADIEAVITSQLLLEPAVPISPAPNVSAVLSDAPRGYVAAKITYADPASQQSVTLNVAAG